MSEIREPTNPILEVQALKKYYPGVKAVDGIDFTVEENSCTGILGPNGAGKTTTIEIIEGINTKDAGNIFYRGKPLDHRFKNEIGIQFQKTALQQFINVGEALILFRAMYPSGMDIDEIVELCGLKKYFKRDIEKLSGGERQRVLLAIALVNDPKVLFLDEPTTGLDPHARQSFWNMIKLLKERGKTILLTTHYMEEAYQLCDWLIIMDRGNIIATGSPQQLLALHFEGSIVSLPKEDLPAEAEQWDGFLRRNGEQYEFMSTHLDELFSLFSQKKISLNHLSITRPDLETLFIKLTQDASHV